MVVPPASSMSGDAGSPKCSTPRVTPFASTVAITHIQAHVVALEPALRGQGEYVEPGCARRAVFGDCLSVELDDVVEPLGVVSRPEAEPFGTDPVLVGRRRLRLDCFAHLDWLL